MLARVPGTNPGLCFERPSLGKHNCCRNADVLNAAPTWTQTNCFRGSLVAQDRNAFSREVRDTQARYPTRNASDVAVDGQWSPRSYQRVGKALRLIGGAAQRRAEGRPCFAPARRAGRHTKRRGMPGRQVSPMLRRMLGVAVGLGRMIGLRASPRRAPLLTMCGTRRCDVSERVARDRFGIPAGRRVRQAEHRLSCVRAGHRRGGGRRRTVRGGLPAPAADARGQAGSPGARGAAVRPVSGASLVRRPWSWPDLLWSKSAPERRAWDAYRSEFGVVCHEMKVV